MKQFVGEKQRLYGAHVKSIAAFYRLKRNIYQDLRLFYGFSIVCDENYYAITLVIAIKLLVRDAKVCLTEYLVTSKDDGAVFKL